MWWYKFLSNKDNFLKVGKLLGFGFKNCDEIPNNGWNKVDMATEGRKLMQAKHIFKEFPNKIAYIIFPKHLTFHQQDDVQGINIYQSLK